MKLTPARLRVTRVRWSRYLGLVALLALGGSAIAADPQGKKAPLPAAPAEAVDPNAAWLEQLRALLRQMESGPEFRAELGVKVPAPGQITLEMLLQNLPEPGRWPELREGLQRQARATNVVAEQKRLQAAGWLFDYLLGEREKILHELPPAPAESEEQDGEEGAWIVEMLRAALTGSHAEPVAESPLAAANRFAEDVRIIEPVTDAEITTRFGPDVLKSMQRVREMMVRFRGALSALSEQPSEEEERKMEALAQEYRTILDEEKKLLEVHQKDELFARYFVTAALGEARGERTVMLPSLLPVVGEEQTKALLRTALQQGFKLEPVGQMDPGTLRLARELVLELGDELKVPQWALAKDLEAAVLFERMLARFPPKEPKNDYDYQAAEAVYWGGLVSRGEVEKALAKIRTVEDVKSNHGRWEIWQKLDRSHPQEVWNYLKAELARFPQSPEWDHFNRLTAVLDRQAEQEGLLRELARNESFRGMDRLTLQQLLARAELAGGRVDDARTRLERVCSVPGKTVEELTQQFEVVITLLTLAELQRDSVRRSNRLREAEALLVQLSAKDFEKARSATDTLVSLLNQAGLHAEAARKAYGVLNKVTPKQALDNSEEDPEAGLLVYETRSLVHQAFVAEVESEHWERAAALLHDRPEWAAADYGGLLDEILPGKSRPLGLYVVKLLRYQQKTTLAKEMLEQLLLRHGGADSLYEAYLDLLGQRARPFLQRLVELDRYEERPLIWLGQLQLNAGETDQAIATLQQAIAVDPSDGEEGRGDRMRVYAVLARAMQAKGDAAKAAFFDGVVKAIRLSETADRWHELGAYSDAMRRYQESLGFFRDAYCIQSRLAVRLAKDGKVEEASAYYQRAFELMPDSFGRVESHCFGCEHVFEGEQSQGIAEKTFSRMLAERSDKPQLHYLLGYLRSEQNRNEEAAVHFRRAIELDPYYLNAVAKLAGVAEKVKMTDRQQDDLILKLVELDPLQRHSSPDFNQVADFARLWMAAGRVAEIKASLPVAPRWPELPASAALLKKQPTSAASRYSGRESTPSFASILSNNQFIMSWVTYIGYMNQTN